ncbi:MAG: DUF4913 domain-containing protein, partial [Longispora sp.]|nr:DUF4913 domain-containing protein [Longispora sp. (in: high G+C Gram-positive bacteria)]
MEDPEVDLSAQLTQLEQQQKGTTAVYPSVTEWITGWLAHNLERRVRGTSANAHIPARWCPTWWDHPEAVARLTALWRAWEALQPDPGSGMSSWWR